VIASPDVYYSLLPNNPLFNNFNQMDALTQYLFTPGTLYRAPALLFAVKDSTLLCGIELLHERIEVLMAVELMMYRRYASMLTDREYAKVALKRTGWPWGAASRNVLDALDRDEMEEQLARDLEVHDCVAKSVRKWKEKIDERIGRNKVELRERRPWEV